MMFLVYLVVCLINFLWAVSFLMNIGTYWAGDIVAALFFTVFCVINAVSGLFYTAAGLQALPIWKAAGGAASTKAAATTTAAATAATV